MARERLLSDEDRARLLQYKRTTRDAQVQQRCLILLALDDGCRWGQIESVLRVSPSTIQYWRRRYKAEGAECVWGHRRGGERAGFRSGCLGAVLSWLKRPVRRVLGLERSTWTCRLLALALWVLLGVSVSGETVRRWLHRAGYHWGRPRPVLRPKDPCYEERMQAIYALLANLGPEEEAVFEDEKQLDLNPPVGGMWMKRGEQAELPTPGKNRQAQVAASINWRTGRIAGTVVGRRRNSKLFIRHLQKLRESYGGKKRIYVICDNASCHRSKAVREYVESTGGQIELVYLPRYAPETNPIEWVWRALKEEVLKNHLYVRMADLIRSACQWLRYRRYEVWEFHPYKENVPLWEACHCHTAA